MNTLVTGKSVHFDDRYLQVETEFSGLVRRMAAEPRH
jgi:hypothetical protein